MSGDNPEGSSLPEGQDQVLPKNNVPAPGALLNVSNEPGKSAGRIVKKIDPVVAKTKLDLDACRDVVDKLISDKEIKIQEQMRTGPTVPVKPKDPIEKSSPTTPCGMVWDNSLTKERFMVCSRCTLHVYDFSHMDLSEAENLVFQREAKKKPSFFKRADGKYLTSNCPVGVANQRARILSIVAGVFALIITVVIMLTMPRYQPPEPASAPVQTQTIKAAGGKSGASQSSSAADQSASVSSGQAPPLQAPNGASMLRIGEDGQVIQGGELLTPGGQTTGPGPYQGTEQAQQNAAAQQLQAPAPQVVAPASQPVPGNGSTQQ